MIGLIAFVSISLYGPAVAPNFNVLRSSCFALSPPLEDEPLPQAANRLSVRMSERRMAVFFMMIPSIYM